jgi:hypothetical protein
MKKTIFHYKDSNEAFDHTVQFIYDPTNFDDAVIHINEYDASFSITKIVDEFTDNQDAQIRHIYLSRHERQIL